MPSITMPNLVPSARLTIVRALRPGLRRAKHSRPSQGSLLHFQFLQRDYPGNHDLSLKIPHEQIHDGFLPLPADRNFAKVLTMPGLWTFAVAVFRRCSAGMNLIQTTRSEIIDGVRHRLPRYRQLGPVTVSAQNDEPVGFRLSDQVKEALPFVGQVIDRNLLFQGFIPGRWSGRV